MTALHRPGHLGDTPRHARVPHHLRVACCSHHDLGLNLISTWLRERFARVRVRKQADLLFQILSLATLVIALDGAGALVYDIFVDGARD